MSMSSYSSVVSSSSSGSSSSDSSSSASSFTGSFSGTSLSSCSTIVAPQADVRKFGFPEYNYFWIENKSKTNPKKSYFYNYKSHAVVWERPLPKDVSLPLYTSTWAPERRNIQEDEDDLIVSDAEETWQKKKRLQIKQRNRRLIFEKTNDTRLQSIEKVLKNKKLLKIAWKLYRLPGESEQDLKKRLFPSTVNDVKIKHEILSDEECIIQQEFSNDTIKQEPPDNKYIEQIKINEQNDVKYLVDGSNLEQIQVNEKSVADIDEDSDSDPENIDALIKLEHMMNFEDSELESNNEDDNEDDEENNYQIKKKSQKKNQLKVSDEVEISENAESEGESEYEEDIDYISNTKYQHFEPQNFDDGSEDYNDEYLLQDFFEIEINESDKENEFINSFNNPVSNDINEETINWTFEQTCESRGDSLLTQEILNPIINSKNVTKKNASNKKKIRKKIKSLPHKVPKLVLKKELDTNQVQVVDNNNNKDEPLVCDMYGTRTLNYNHLPNMKIPRWQICQKLSENEDSDIEFKDSDIKVIRKSSRPKKYINLNESEESETEFAKFKNNADEKKVPPLKLKLKQGALELKNWFPKKKSQKRKRSGEMSDSSWCESNFGDYSDIDDTDITLIKMKKEKKSDSDVETKRSRSQGDVEHSYNVNREEINNSTNFPIKRPKNSPVSCDLTVDLNLVKDEPKSPEAFELKTDCLDPPTEDATPEISSHPTFNAVSKSSPRESTDSISQPYSREETVAAASEELATKAEAHDTPNQWTTMQSAKKNVVASDSDSSSSSSSSSCSRSSCSGCGSSSSSSEDEDDQEGKKGKP